MKTYSKLSKLVFVDVETYSPVDLPSQGVVSYAKHKEFQIIIGAFHTTDKKHMIVGHKACIDFALGLEKEGYMFVAHNASFEYYAFQGLIPANKWRCTSVMSCYFGGLASLKNALKCFDISSEKLDTGKDLIKKIIDVKGDITGLTYEDYDKFKKYCAKDAEICKELYDKILSEYGEVPDQEWKYFCTTLHLMGQQIDFNIKRVEKCIKLRDYYDKVHGEEFKKAYNFNPNSFKQTMEWVQARNPNIEKMSKPYIKAYKGTMSDEVREMFDFKHASCPSILKKFDKFKAGSIYTPLQHFGTITGRYSSRGGVNILNMPKSLESFDVFVSPEEAVETHDYKIPTLLKSQLRACIEAPEGYEIFASDFALIEFRILMYICGHIEDVVGKDIYCVFGEKMFNKPVRKGDIERQIAKSCVLGLGYGMSAKTLWASIQTIDEDIGVEVARKGWKTYHRMFPMVSKLYKMIDKRIEQGALSLTLLNGRQLYFPKYKLVGSKLYPANNYGSGFTGSYIQANARELLFEKQEQFIQAGYDVKFNVYDEIVGYIPANEQQKEIDKKKILNIMRAPVDWLPSGVVDATVSITKTYAEA